MVFAIPTLSLLSTASGEVSMEGKAALGFALAAIVLLVWQLRRCQAHYAEELAEQVRQTEAEQERAREAKQASEALARESQARSEMLATLSREVRSHLNGIIGSADLLFDNSLKPQQREHLATLRASAESLHQSLNDVLDYSDIETRQIKIARASFDLRQPLIEVVEYLSPLALLKGLELVLIVASDVPVLVTGDAARLRQVLLNLASNAVKFTATGRVVLRVEIAAGSSAPSKSGGSWLHFSVSDTGEGIPEELQATLFERFGQSDRSSPRKFGGSGLELSISKRLVELMGGQIGARNLPDSGAEFWVVLALPADATQPASPAPAIVRNGFHVVVLDDLAAARLSTSALLQRLGLDHDVTDTPADAAALLRDALEADITDRVLLLDESVAVARASEIETLLAEDTSLVRTRVVLLSRDPEAVPTAGLTLPITTILRKPIIRPEALLEALLTKSAPGAPRSSNSSAPFVLPAGPRASTRAHPLVLVVDDDVISRSVASQLLAILGCTVERSTSGADAIERTRTSRFDLVFMDCQMPTLDGYETTLRIRELAGKEAPPIVALTANTSPADREKCFAVGMCDFVDKPVRKAELARVVKRWTQPDAVGPT